MQGVILSKPREWMWGWCEPCQCWTGGSFRRVEERTYTKMWGVALPEPIVSYRQEPTMACWWCGEPCEKGSPAGGYEGRTLYELTHDAS